MANSGNQKLNKYYFEFSIDSLGTTMCVPATSKEEAIRLAFAQWVQNIVEEGMGTAKFLGVNLKEYENYFDEAEDDAQNDNPSFKLPTAT
jgi:hypothetical protein